MYPNLQRLEPFLDEVFQHFYNRLLNDQRFRSFFTRKQQIPPLIEQHKHNFLDSLEESDAQLFTRYQHLGERYSEIAAIWSEQDENQWLERTDRALYRAKQGDRNRVCSA